jgi:hypothetical protein
VSDLGEAFKEFTVTGNETSDDLDTAARLGVPDEE